MVMTLLTRPKKTVATVVVATDGSGDFNTDGVADDVEIQAAIDSLPTGGGCIYMKEGDYNIDAVITVTNNNVSIVGCGRSTHIISQGINGIYITGDHCTIEKIFFEGNDVGVVNGILIEGNYSAITNCWVEDYHHGILLNGDFNYANISNNFCESNQVGINTNGVTLANYNIISNNFCIDNTGNGISINLQQYSLVIGNICYGSDSANGRGIKISGCDYCDIIGNLCVGNERGIDVTAHSYYININGNFCQDNVDYGIGLLNDSDFVNINGNFSTNNGIGINIPADSHFNNITGNYISYSSTSGIDISSHYNNINGNSTLNSSLVGINIDGNYNNISGNHLNDTGTGIIISNASNKTFISGNMLYGSTTKITDNGINSHIFNNQEN